MNGESINLILGLLNQAQLNGCDGFILASDQSRDKRHLKLFRYLRFLYFEQGQKEYNREDAFRSIFGTQEIFDANGKKKIRRTIQKLKMLIFKFQQKSVFWESPVLQAKSHIELLSNGHNDKALLKTLEQYIENLDIEDEVEYFSLLQQFYSKYYFYQTDDNYKRKFANALEKYGYTTDVCYVIHKCKELTERLSKLETIGIKPTPNLLEQIDNTLALFNTLNFDQSPIAQLFILALKLFRRPSEKGYILYRDTFKGKIDTIHAEKKILFTFLVNSANRLKQSDNYLEELFDLYHFANERNILTIDNRILSSMFNNVINVSCAISKYEFAKSFFEEKFNLLNVSKTIKDQIKNLAEIHFLFQEKKYLEILSKVDKIKNIDYSYTLTKHIIAFKALYEAHGYDAYDDITVREASFREMLSYNSDKGNINKITQKRYLLFISLLRKIVNFPYNNYSKVQLLETLETSQYKPNQTRWLREKINLLNERQKRVKFG